MLIDVHAHIGHSTPGMAPPVRVATYAGVCGVDYVLVSNGDAALDPPGAANLDETDANVACLAASRVHPRLLPVYWVPRTSGGIAAGAAAPGIPAGHER